MSKEQLQKHLRNSDWVRKPTIKFSIFFLLFQKSVITEQGPKDLLDQSQD